MIPRRKSSSDAKRMNAPRPQRQMSPNRLFKAKSAPATSRGNNGSAWRNIKGIMRVQTLEDSLHSKYGGSQASGSNNGSDSGDNGTRKIRIKFENIEIREYARTVGDNPSVSSGPPVTISWEYNPETTVLSIEEYERNRPTRRTQSEMILPRSIRMEMLRKEWNVSQQQIASAVRSGIRAKSQRRTTLGNLGKTEKVEELIEGATKQLLKTLFLRKSTSKKAQELGDQIQKVNKQRAQIIMEHHMRDDFSDSESPWQADLLPDDSDVDISTHSKDCGEKQLWMRPASSSDDGSKDGAPKVPKRESSETNLDSSGSKSTDIPASVAHQQETQSSGESASQTEQFPPTKSPAKPCIVAEEPEDDFIGNERKLEKQNSIPVDC